MYQAEEQEPPDIPATLLVLFAAVPVLFPSMLQGSEHCLCVHWCCLHAHTALHFALGQWYGPSLHPHLAPSIMPKVNLYLLYVPASVCVSIVGLHWQTGSMSFSGQNILDSPWQVPDGCCQMETDSFLLNDFSSIRLSSPFHDSDVLKIVKA